MNKNLWIGVGGVIFAATSTMVAKKQMEERNIRVDLSNIVVLGDSVAFGYQTVGGVTTYLKEEFPESKVTNKGINGLTSYGLLERLENGEFDQKVKDATVILLNIGGNDLLDIFKAEGPKGIVRHFPKKKAQYRKNMRRIYAVLNELNPSVRIVQNSLYNSLEKEFRYYGFTNLLFVSWNQAIGGKQVIKVNTSPIGKNREIWLDQVHPTEEGYKILCDIIVDRLKPYVKLDNAKA